MRGTTFLNNARLCTSIFLSLNHNLADQAIGARTHAHDISALAEAFEAYSTLDLPEACHRAALHIKHIDFRPFNAIYVEHTPFERHPERH